MLYKGKPGLEFHISPLEDGLKVFDRFNRDASHPVNYDLPLLNVDYLKLKGSIAKALHQWQCRIPEEIRDLMEKINYRQLEMLRLLTLSQFSIDLMKSAPALLWLIADAMVAGKIGIETALKMTGVKRKNILASIMDGNVSGEQRFVERVRPVKGGFPELDNIKRVLQSDKAGYFAGYKIIPANLLEFIVHNPNLIVSCVVRNSAHAAYLSTAKFNEIILLLFDTLQLGESIRIPNCEKTVASRPDEKSLQTLHDNWVKRSQKVSAIARAMKYLPEDEKAKLGSIKKSGIISEEEILAKVYFPKPPLPGDDSIIPITNFADLVKESKEMNHCVSSYLDRIMNGNCYIYRVLKPERATLELHLNGKMRKRTSIAQLQGRSNIGAQYETRERVQLWLKNAKRRQ